MALYKIGARQLQKRSLVYGQTPINYTTNTGLTSDYTNWSQTNYIYPSELFYNETGGYNGQGELWIGTATGVTRVLLSGEASSSSATTATLQSAYNAGKTIDVATSLPIQFSSSTLTSALKIDGTLKVNGNRGNASPTFLLKNDPGRDSFNFHNGGNGYFRSEINRSLTLSGAETNFYSIISSTISGNSNADLTSYRSRIALENSQGKAYGFVSEFRPRANDTDEQTNIIEAFGFNHTIEASTFNESGCTIGGVNIDSSAITINEDDMEVIGVRMNMSNYPNSALAFKFDGQEAITGSFSNSVVTANPDAYIQIKIGANKFYVPAYSTKPL